MKHLTKIFAAAGAAALLALWSLPAEAWWGWSRPYYGYGYGPYSYTRAYKADPAYWYAPPRLRAAIRRYYRYGPMTGALGYPRYWY
jgi:hypothetical protein